MILGYVFGLLEECIIIGKNISFGVLLQELELASFENNMLRLRNHFYFQELLFH